MKKIFVLTLGIVSFLSGFAQKTKSSDSTQFKLQFDFLSNYVYNGRADSVTYPYQITTATLNFGKGLYTSFSADYLLANGQNRFDFFELDLGKEYSVGNNTSGEIYASKYFYSSNANVISGDITSDLGASLNHDFGLFQVNNTADIFFSGATDLQYTLGLSKSIDFESEQGTWNITPSINAIGTSLGYYESVVNRKLNPAKGVKTKLANANLPTVNITTTVQDKKFTLMASEFSLPISYDKKKWGFEFTPTYAMPFNSVTTNSIVKTTTGGVTTTNTANSTPYSEKNLRNIFYVQAGIFFKF